MRGEPPADAYDFGAREDGKFLVRVGCVFGDVDGGFAVDAVAEVGGEGGLEVLKIHRKYGSSAKARWMHATAAGISAVVIGRTSIAILNEFFKNNDNNN